MSDSNFEELESQASNMFIEHSNGEMSYFNDGKIIILPERYIKQVKSKYKEINNHNQSLLFCKKHKHKKVEIDFVKSLYIYDITYIEQENYISSEKLFFKMLFYHRNTQIEIKTVSRTNIEKFSNELDKLDDFYKISNIHINIKYVCPKSLTFTRDIVGPCTPPFDTGTIDYSFKSKFSRTYSKSVTKDNALSFIKNVKEYKSRINRDKLLAVCKGK